MLASLLTAVQVLADGAAAVAPAGKAAPQGGLQQLIQFAPMIAIAVFFYFIVWRPQSAKQREAQNMIAALKKGDEVVTTGGLIGKITGMTESTITLEVQEKVRLKVQRAAVTGLYHAPPSSAGSTASNTASK